MKYRRWLTICLVLALAGVMLWAGPGLAQCRRGDYSGGGAGNQWCQGGSGPGSGAWGQGANNAGNYAGYQNCPRGGGSNPQATMGPRGPRGGRYYQPDTQTSSPAPGVTQ
jgi:hypothetical protein